MFQWQHPTAAVDGYGFRGAGKDADLPFRSVLLCWYESSPNCRTILALSYAIARSRHLVAGAAGAGVHAASCVVTQSQRSII